MENTPQEAVLKKLPLVDIPEKNIRIRYMIKIYTNYVWDHILDPGFRVQILFPYRAHRMFGPLRTLICPWSCFA